MKQGKMNQGKRKLGNKGFSLVELIVVIAIMAILIGVLAPALINNIAKSRESKDINSLATVQTAVITAINDDAGNVAFNNAFNEGEWISVDAVLGTAVAADTDFTRLVKEYAGNIPSAQARFEGRVELNNGGSPSGADSTGNLLFMVRNGQVTVALTNLTAGSATALTDADTYFGNQGNRAYVAN